MNTSSVHALEFSVFTDADSQFRSMKARLAHTEMSTEDHASIEAYLKKEGDELLRLMFQATLDQQAANESRLPCVTNSEGETLTHARNDTHRQLVTFFGSVTVRRIGYNSRNRGSAFPTDARLNLSADQYSDGLHQQVVSNVIHLSYDNAVDQNQKVSTGQVPKRQSIKVAVDAAQDFESFYQKRELMVEETSDLLILTFDGKGIVMLPDGLREATRKRAADSKNKLQTRLSTGEKKDRKRMAEVAAVYTTRPDPRTAESVMNMDKKDSNVHKLRIPPRNKRVWASVERESEQVIAEAFDEALKRDPEQKRRWVVVVDGEQHQLRLIEKVMKQKQVKATIMMDFIHVLEYLWKAGRCFFKKSDPKVETWVAERAVKILQGQCCEVAKDLLQSADKRKLKKHKAIGTCSGYLSKNKDRLRYDVALAAGLPIASGVIEGACRHLINDRIDITGARWSLRGAEAILKLRALNSSGDMDAYWRYHRNCSKERNYSHLLSLAPS